MEKFWLAGVAAVVGGQLSRAEIIRITEALERRP
jgi:hypothetical protein